MNPAESTTAPRTGRNLGDISLGTLISGLAPLPGNAPETMRIRGLAHDSRSVAPGFLFVALKGLHADGHRFMEDAVAHGAVALVGETPPTRSLPVPFIKVQDSRSALWQLAARFYEEPFRGLKLIGITGTNGKTTTSYLIESILGASNAIPGVMGTINHRYPGNHWKVPMTTPESLEIMKSLRRMADAGVTHVVMEVSSHALKQRRVEGYPFQTAVFTNLSREHLDYHATMEDYFESKSLLFRGLGQRERTAVAPATAVINMDDPMGPSLAALTHAEILSYGLEPSFDISADNIRLQADGISATLHTPSGNLDIHSPLVGAFNLHNIMAAAGAAISLGIGLDHVKAGVEALSGVPGRLEPVPNPRGVTILVDYAHTPDALQKVLEALRPIAPKRIITVFGCGGDRDAGKRSEMGRVATTSSDLVIITSDNPRSEAPEAIIAQIEEGVHHEKGARLETEGSAPLKRGEGSFSKAYLVEPDRSTAISLAVRAASPGDVVLIAGKGHEDYQIIGSRTIPFDDRRVAAEAAREAF